MPSPGWYSAETQVIGDDGRIHLVGKGLYVIDISPVNWGGAADGKGDTMEGDGNIPLANFFQHGAWSATPPQKVFGDYLNEPTRKRLVEQLIVVGDAKSDAMCSGLDEGQVYASPRFSPPASTQSSAETVTQP